MLIKGYVTDQNQSPVIGALIEVKGEDFITLYRAESNESGYYQLDIPSGRYPFLTAVKDYGVHDLEYWCQNISLQSDMSLDVSFGKLEIYGLHVFSVKGAGNGLMAYFRPMSLVKFQQGERDIAPENMTLKAFVDGFETPVLTTNLVKEIAEDREMSAYLIQVDTSGIDGKWHKFDLQIKDKDCGYGAATIFNDDASL